MCKKLSLNVNRARFTFTFDDRYPWQQCTSALVAGYLRAAQRLLAAPFSASGHSFEACSSSLPILRRHNLLNAAFLPVFSVIIPFPTLAGCSNWSLSLSFRTKLAFFPFSNRATQTETPRTLFLFSCSRAFHRLVMTKKDYIYRLECDEDFVRQFVIRKKPHSPRIVTTLLSLSHYDPRTKLVPVGETSRHLMI